MTRNVTLLGEDTVLVDISSPLSGEFTMWFTVTDTTPPLLTVDEPVDGLFTRGRLGERKGFRSGFRLGRTDDRRATATWNDAGVFSETVDLPTEGTTLINITAKDGAENSSTAYRLVTRDTSPPHLAVLDPATVQSTTTNSLIDLEIEWADTSFTFVSVNDDTIDSGLESSARDTVLYEDYPLDMGQNKIVVRAVDFFNDTTEVFGGSGGRTPQTLPHETRQ